MFNQYRSLLIDISNLDFSTFPIHEISSFISSGEKVFTYLNKGHSNNFLYRLSYTNKGKFRRCVFFVLLISCFLDENRMLKIEFFNRKLKIERKIASSRRCKKWHRLDIDELLVRVSPSTIHRRTFDEPTRCSERNENRLPKN